MSSIAWWLFLLGSISDAIDGWLARRYDEGTTFGARLDPLTDKILIAAPLIWLASTERLPMWAVWLLITREILITDLRAHAEDGAPASLGGKSKTLILFLSLLLLIWPSNWNGYYYIIGIGWWLFWPSLLLAILSAINYFKFQSKSDQF